MKAFEKLIPQKKVILKLDVELSQLKNVWMFKSRPCISIKWENCYSLYWDT